MGHWFMRWLRVGIVSLFVLAAASAALAGGLAGESESDSAAPSDPPELTATAEIRRSFMEPGVVAIAVTNHSTAPVQVRGVELVSESFAPLGIQETDATVPPSVNPRDLLIEYGEARCPDGAASTAAASTVVLDVETEDGAAHRVTAELLHPSGTLDRLLGETCAAAFVAENVEVSLGAFTAAADGTLEATLGLEPAPGVTVEATEIRGSVLYELTASGLGGQSIAVHFDADRCDGHAVGDAKQPFAFTVWLAIDGAAPLPAPIPADHAQQETLMAMHEARCGRAD